MKKFLLLKLLLVFSIGLFAQTSGKLTVTVTTEDAGGNYKPKNIVAIWIEDSNNNFVKTLLAYADRRIQYLYTWKAVTASAGNEYNTVDAITGATQSSHGTRTCYWDGTNTSSVLMADGTYTVHMELTDKHAQGSYSSFNFVKGADSQVITPSDVTSFVDISISWVPDVKTGIEEMISNEVTVFPNPTGGEVKVSGSIIKSISVFDLAGKSLLHTQTNTANLSGFRSGVYILSIETDNGVIVRKVEKK